jgi:hypothetical protein
MRGIGENLFRCSRMAANFSRLQPRFKQSMTRTSSDMREMADFFAEIGF